MAFSFLSPSLSLPVAMPGLNQPAPSTAGVSPLFAGVVGRTLQTANRQLALQNGRQALLAGAPITTSAMLAGIYAQAAAARAGATAAAKGGAY